MNERDIYKYMCMYMYVYACMKEGSRVNTSMYERGNMYEYDRE